MVRCCPLCVWMECTCILYVGGDEHAILLSSSVRKIPAFAAVSDRNGWTVEPHFPLVTETLGRDIV
jgi:hypothetical protein